MEELAPDSKVPGLTFWLEEFKINLVGLLFLLQVVLHFQIPFFDKSEAIKKLHKIAARAEKDFIPNSNFDELIQKEKDHS